ncbi:hypothetical protein [Olsenella sp. DNF00959]|uniref:hypothetical protein n=1 Tax=Olsenella sp. DNF00959 TaxID=1476999 RepID=UPI000785A4E0|nr:hypothetical protein [Olsenella sp. DNF00959]KXB63286.1 hypothetical protein HMPREF1868_00820 [Olsenella sp. DNF00959]
MQEEKYDNPAMRIDDAATKLRCLSDALTLMSTSNELNEMVQNALVVATEVMGAELERIDGAVREILSESKGKAA